MRVFLVTLGALLIPGLYTANQQIPGFVYPNAPRGDVVDDYSGTKVPDPYRWMEALDAKEVTDWVAASNAVTESYLVTLRLREHFNRRLTELWDYPRVRVP